MGTNNEIGVEMYETNIFPTRVNNSNLSSDDVVDYQLGEDTLAILLGDGNVYWAGMRLAY
jgi:alpha-tubulin suppressor-like RCC1 family protein